MFFDLEDYATEYRNTIDPNCVNPNIPKVDNTSIECTQLISTDCVVTPKGFPYLGIGAGETVTSVIEKIKEKFKSISFTIQNLGTGIGVLKNFSGSVLSAKTIAAGNNIQITEANDTITINAIGGGSGGGVIDVTHTQLLSFKNGNQLVPGTFYRITDFRTMYDQPDFDANGVAKTSVAAKVGPIEPIIVLALTDNKLSSKAYQEAYPKDTIEYMLEFTTPVNNTVTKGRIIYRKDEWGNETDFDHRNVLFKRYLHPYLQTNVSHKDTSLTSLEVKFLYSGLNSNSSGVKSKGYFASFQQGNFGPFDLPNNVITDLSFDSTLGLSTYNSTFKSIVSSTIQFCHDSILEVSISNSKVNKVNVSSVYSLNNSFGINTCDIDEIANSIIGVGNVSTSKIKRIHQSNIGEFDSILSEISVSNSGVLNQTGLPIDSLSVTNSKIYSIDNAQGSLVIINTYLTKVGDTVFSSNTIENVKGGSFYDLILKPQEQIKHLNILGNAESINFSLSTVIYDTTLSKEIIQYPNGFYIKHYDQFGAAVINNVNA